MATPAWVAPNVGWTTGNVYGASDINTVGNDLLHVGTPASVEAIWSAATSLVNSTWTTVLYGAENWDTDGFHSIVSNTSRITIPAGLGGRYLVHLGVAFAPNSTGYRAIRCRINGAGTPTELQGQVASSVIQLTESASREYVLNAGDYIEVQAYQGSGGALNTADGWFSARKVSN